ncbi:MAG TPA: hypothetical protein ENG87_00475 [Candidatus Pacearchaeota archaeon]|nr:hypothetical protein BMS3Abin17_00358 [archaeon BMS3Abin17]HDK41823.1 hypothetical protein [Candidatus Pacearchaeota archaeon]HDZ60224.1 hypothetical protein [Candidatus Pacearchaeota archaeon]
MKTKKIKQVERRIASADRNIDRIDRNIAVSENLYGMVSSKKEYRVNSLVAIGDIYEERIPVYEKALQEANSEASQANNELEKVLSSANYTELESKEMFEQRTKEQANEIFLAKNNMYQKSLEVKTAEKRLGYITKMGHSYVNKSIKMENEWYTKVDKTLQEMTDKIDELKGKKLNLESLAKEEKENLEYKTQVEKTINKIDSGENSDGYYDFVTLQNAIIMGLVPSKIKNSLDKGNIIPYYAWNGGLDDSLEAINVQTKEQGKIRQLPDESYVFEMDLGHQKIEFPIIHRDEEKVDHGVSRISCKFPEGLTSIAILSPEKSLRNIKELELRDKSMGRYSRFAESLKIVADYYVKESERLKENE